MSKTGRFGYFETFFEKLGVKGRKSIALLGVFYAVCWLILIICHIFGDDVIINRIPAPLIHVTTAFPFIFLAFLLLAWGLNSFFSLMFRKLSFPLFVLFCLVLWLVWAFGNTVVCLYFASALWSGWGRMIPIALLLMTAVYAGVHVRIYYMFGKGRGFRYYLLHWSLFLLSVGGFLPYRDKDSSLVETIFRTGSVIEAFAIFTLAQLFVYNICTLFTPVHMYLELSKRR